MDTTKQTFECSPFDSTAHDAFLAFEKRLHDPAAEETVPLTLNIPIKWAALMVWCELRHNQRWSKDAVPPDGEFSFDFTDEQWNIIRRDFGNTLNNAYEDQVHALNNGFSSLLTSRSNSEKATSNAVCNSARPDNPDDCIPF